MNAKHICVSTLALMVSIGWCAMASANPLLGTVGESFAVLGGAGVSSAGATTIVGNVGASPTNAISGFNAGAITGGTATSTGVAQQAQADALVAYNLLSTQVATHNLTGFDLGGMTLSPGVYNYVTSAQLTGDLTLDAGGLSDVAFIFKIGTTLTTATDAIVTLINAGSNDGVFFQVGSSATLGDSTQLVGNILASTSIVLDPFAQISCGRALGGILVGSGIVSMANANHVSISDNNGCANGLDGGIGADTIGGGGASVPEPSSVALLGFGALGLGLLLRRRRTKTSAA